MHVHVVDHNTKHLSLIAKMIVSTFPDLRLLTFSKTDEPRDANMAAADLVVISGGTRLVHLNRGAHRRLMKRLVELGRPVFGICLGAEAIADYFGARLHELPVRESGVRQVRLLSPDLIRHFDAGALPVYHHHGWVVRDAPAELEMLAETEQSVELFRHTALPFWGAQFHPEAKRDGNQGYRLFVYAMQREGLVERTSD